MRLACLPPQWLSPLAILAPRVSVSLLLTLLTASSLFRHLAVFVAETLQGARYMCVLVTPRAAPYSLSGSRHYTSVLPRIRLH